MIFCIIFPQNKPCIHPYLPYQIQAIGLDLKLLNSSAPTFRFYLSSYLQINISISLIYFFFYQGEKLTPPEGCPSFICDLMKLCWKTEPRDRLTFPEIYEKLAKARAEMAPSQQEINQNIEIADDLPRPPIIIPTLDIMQQTEDLEGYLKPQKAQPPEYMVAIA